MYLLYTCQTMWSHDHAYLKVIYNVMLLIRGYSYMYVMFS